jgi:ADP-heptose:LPS heptosyltransferase
MRFFLIKSTRVKKITLTGVDILEEYLQKQILKKYDKTLIIMRTDAIGDYVLFRNFLEMLRVSEKFKGYYIVLFGNIAWKDIAETYDKKYIDEFIWFNRFDIFNSEYSRTYVLYYSYILFLKKAEFLINPVFSREMPFNKIAQLSKVQYRAAPTDDGINKSNADVEYYNKIINSLDYTHFEFARNIDFFEKLLNKKINFLSPYFEIINTNILIDGEYILVFPGAGAVYRRWSTENYANLIDILAKQYNYRFILAGSNQDEAIVLQILHNSKTDMLNYSGKTNLVQLIELIAKAKLLISNETSAVHIAVATSTPFICISNANHIGRFNPYPKETYQKGEYVYPDVITLDSIESLIEKYKYYSDLDINSISVENVLEKIKKTL